VTLSSLLALHANTRRPANNAPMSPAVATAARADWPAACALLARHLPPPRDLVRADHLVQMLVAGEIDPAGLRVVRRGQTVVGAMLTQLTPGNAASVWPPAGDGADTLTADAVARLRSAGVTHAQCLLDALEGADPSPLVRAGFRRVTALHFYRRSGTPPPPADDRLQVMPFAAAGAKLAIDTILATYAGSLDCPELDGVRTADDVRAGYTTAFDGSAGWLACLDAQPVGVGILLPDSHGVELAYLGLIPEARGRGLGVALLKQALSRAGGADVRLSVDARNTPARRLYERAGFEPTVRRDVYLWFAK